MTAKITFLKSYFPRKVLTVLAVLLSHYTLLSAQLTIEKLDYSKVPQKKIKAFIEKQKNEGLSFFADFIPKCYSDQDSSKFRQVSTSYIIHENSEKVWDEYLSIHPYQAYSGRIVDFGFLYSKSDDKIIYKEDEYDKMKVGQLFFFNLKLLGGIRNLGVADEVTAIDPEQKMIRFCYLDNGKSEGTQEIQLNDTEDGFTRITHETWYRSDSNFRDIILYPFFHKRTVNEYHHIIRNRIENAEQFISAGVTLK